MAGAQKLLTPGGGGVIIQPASSIASDVTVQVPSQNCTLGIQGPAFSVYNNTAQGISTGTWTKVQFNTEEFDTNNNYDSTTNYRFTPTVAGYYQINGIVAVNGTSITQVLGAIYKNNTEYKRGNQLSFPSGVTNTNSCVVSAVVYFNGSTDYVEIYGFANGTSPQFVSGGANSVNCSFNGALVRAA